MVERKAVLLEKQRISLVALSLDWELVERIRLWCSCE
jgi:hypothetical protein